MCIPAYAQKFYDALHQNFREKVSLCPQAWANYLSEPLIPHWLGAGSTSSDTLSLGGSVNLHCTGSNRARKGVCDKGISCRFSKEERTAGGQCQERMPTFLTSSAVSPSLDKVIGAGDMCQLGSGPGDLLPTEVNWMLMGSWQDRNCWVYRSWARCCSVLPAATTSSSSRVPGKGASTEMTVVRSGSLGEREDGEKQGWREGPGRHQSHP